MLSGFAKVTHSHTAGLDIGLHLRSALWLDTRWQWKLMLMPTVECERQKERERECKGKRLLPAEATELQGEERNRMFTWHALIENNYAFHVDFSWSWITGEVSGGAASADLHQHHWLRISGMASAQRYGRSDREIANEMQRLQGRSLRMLSLKGDLATV